MIISFLNLFTFCVITNYSINRKHKTKDLSDDDENTSTTTTYYLFLFDSDFGIFHGILYSTYMLINALPN